jgi:hypothetical protein
MTSGFSLAAVIGAVLGHMLTDFVRSRYRSAEDRRNIIYWWMAVQCVVSLVILTMAVVFIGQDKYRFRDSALSRLSRSFKFADESSVSSATVASIGDGNTSPFVTLYQAQK